MATSDQEQKSVMVPQHKRLAAGEPITGTSYGARTQDKAPKPSSGLSHLKPKK